MFYFIQFNSMNISNAHQLMVKFTFKHDQVSRKSSLFAKIIIIVKILLQYHHRHHLTFHIICLIKILQIQA